MGNLFSTLTNVAWNSPNFNKRTDYGTGEVDTITPHCTDGLMSWKACNGVFGEGKNCSCNYLIDKDGIICGVVPEELRSWCSSSRENDSRAITFELASEKGSPCKMPDIVINNFIALCVDIMKRYNKNKLVYLGDNEQQKNYKCKANEMKITFHKWFDKNRTCPEKYFISRCPEIVGKINTFLSGNTTAEKLYYVQVGAFSKYENAENLVKELKSKGFNAIVK